MPVPSRQEHCRILLAIDKQSFFRPHGNLRRIAVFRGLVCCRAGNRNAAWSLQRRVAAGL